MTDWNALDEVEATEQILRAALEAELLSLHISCDYRGGQVYFQSGEDLQMFDFLPRECSDRVCRYLKRMANIDLLSPPPMEGVSTVRLDSDEYTLVVKTLKGALEEDISVRICRL